MFGLGAFGFLLFMVVLIWAWSREEKRKDEKAARANDRVLDLRQRAIDAHLCKKCRGKGVFGSWDRQCKECNGLGYTYKEPPLSILHPDSKD
jgi:RecJ-like exonuclease